MQIKERIEEVFGIFTKGMKGYEIAKELGVDASTVSRDIQFLIPNNNNLNSLLKKHFHLCIKLSIEGIRNVLKECWNILYY